METTKTDKKLVDYISYSYKGEKVFYDLKNATDYDYTVFV